MESNDYSGRLIFNINQDGEPTGKGYYQTWDLEILHFDRISKHTLRWRSATIKSPLPPKWLETAVRGTLKIPVIE